jgi:sialate O-acetylesterase
MKKLMPGLIQNWRGMNGESAIFHFIMCRSHRYNYGGGTNSAFLREAQLKASAAIPNIGMACIMDVGESACIHPANKEVGGRTAGLPGISQYLRKKKVLLFRTGIKEMTVEGCIVKLTFDHAGNGLTTFGKDLTQF